MIMGACLCKQVGNWEHEAVGNHKGNAGRTTIFKLSFKRPSSDHGLILLTIHG